MTTLKNLGTTGLSMSQAQSISNLCNQASVQITSELSKINNFTARVTVNEKSHVTVQGNEIPKDIIAILQKKANYAACQAFLMECIKAKDNALKELRLSSFVNNIPKPELGNLKESKKLQLVDENWGMEQLTSGEWCEYIEQEAIAAHLGQFIHNKGKLTTLREQLPSIPSIEWMEVKTGEKTPVEITPHHNSEELLALHNKIAELHRIAESRVNYFKAKIKNAVTTENARRASEIEIDNNAISVYNQEINDKYKAELRKWNDNNQTLLVNFEKTRNESIQRVSALRIIVDSRFQKTIDEFLTKE